jgi:hypothetical protein
MGGKSEVLSGHHFYPPTSTHVGGGELTFVNLPAGRADSEPMPQGKLVRRCGV